MNGRLVRVPRHGDAGPGPHRQEFLIEQPDISWEAAVLMIGVDIIKPFRLHQIVPLKIRRLQPLVRSQRGVAAGEQLQLRGDLPRLFESDFLELDVLIQAHPVEADQVRFVPDLPETDFIPVARKDGRRIVAPGGGIGLAARPLQPVLRILQLLRRGPAGGERKHRLQFDSNLAVGFDKRIHRREIPAVCGRLKRVPLDGVADHLRAAKCGGEHLLLLLAGAPPLRMRADAEQETGSAPFRRPGRFQEGERTALLRSLPRANRPHGPSR